MLSSKQGRQEKRLANTLLRSGFFRIVFRQHMMIPGRINVMRDVDIIHANPSDSEMIKSYFIEVFFHVFHAIETGVHVDPIHLGGNCNTTSRA